MHSLKGTTSYYDSLSKILSETKESECQYPVNMLGDN